MPQTKKQFFMRTTPLLLALLIDSMGLGILFPILTTIILNPETSILPVALSSAWRNFDYGLLLASFMLCWFFGAAILGDVSDQIGRKKSLFVCLFGGGVGYALSAAAIIYSNFWLLILGRVIAGFTAGSQTIAQAAIVDVSEPQHTARNIGYMLFAVSLGFVFGPMVGGFLGDSSIVSWFSPSLPMIFSAAISWLNAILLLAFFEDTYPASGKLSINFTHAIDLFISAFKNKAVEKLSLIFLFQMIGWSAFFSFIALLLLNRFHYGAVGCGLYMAYLGCGFGLGFMGLVGYCERNFAAQGTIIVTTILNCIMSLFIIITHSEALTWILSLPLAMAEAVAYATTISLFSKQVDETLQGWVMGITGSIMALSFAVINFILGFAATLSINIPFLLSAAAFGFSAYLLFRDHFHERRKMTIESIDDKG